MKVRVCASCPYLPRDLGEHFAPQAPDLCCLYCPAAIAAAAVSPDRHKMAPLPSGHSLSPAVEIASTEAVGCG